MGFDDVPGVLNAAISGTTIKVPVNTHLSPAFARSTMSPRTMTSKLDGSWVRKNTLKIWIQTDLLGILPVGISLEFSWIRTFCQSTNLDWSVFKVQCCRLKHWRPWHMTGWLTKTGYSYYHAIVHISYSPLCTGTAVQHRSWFYHTHCKWMSHTKAQGEPLLYGSRYHWC